MTEIIVAAIAALAAIAAATLGLIGVIVGVRAKRTGTREHDEMADRVERGFASIHRRMDSADQHRHVLDDRVTDVGRNVGEMRDQFVRHLEHHLDVHADEPGDRRD